MAAGLAASSESAAAAEIDVVETDVEVKTPDGTCQRRIHHPKSGSYAGVLVWPDAFGLRAGDRDIGKRIAAEGYSVLVPNPYYRWPKLHSRMPPTSIFKTLTTGEAAAP